MRVVNVVPVMSGVLLLAACAASDRSESQPSSSTVVQQSADMRRQYDESVANLRQSLAAIGAPLATLTPEQQASVAALVVVARTAAQDELLRPGGSAMEVIWPDVQDICPPLKSISFSRGGCLDQQVAYASAMASCEHDQKQPDECEREAAPAAAALMDCEFKALAALPGIIGRIPGRTWPPRPFPWEIAAGTTRRP